jgi:4a-hydroxytetrahydrobiopterin dehydratase
MNSWTITSTHLEKTFTFANFDLAMLFVQQAAVEISALDHHPTWTNTYNRIHVSLSTHDAGNTVTEKDWELARALDTLYEKNHHD